MTRLSDKRIELLRYYAERGRLLRDAIALIGIEWSTALRLCRRHEIFYSDHKRRKRKIDVL